jgi:hypothetical protein
VKLTTSPPSSAEVKTAWSYTSTPPDAQLKRWATLCLEENQSKSDTTKAIPYFTVNMEHDFY